MCQTTARHTPITPQPRAACAFFFRQESSGNLERVPTNNLRTMQRRPLDPAIAQQLQESSGNLERVPTNNLRTMQRRPLDPAIAQQLNRGRFSWLKNGDSRDFDDPPGDHGAIPVDDSLG
ncbi:hypothetical protein QE152_g38405 [Popillia japonica]|uniref:Uncharacterized protein n=1 Tax=Popillia japonica TaxID=7064 RepID=A0AAW1HX63_POPJA